MATLTLHQRPAVHSSTLRRLGVLLLAMALAFVAGRVTVAGRAPPQPAALARPPAQPATPAPAPWQVQGFRDAETSADTCTSPDCNG